MSQSEIRFKERGFHQLKGVPQRWLLYWVEHEGKPQQRTLVRPRVWRCCVFGWVVLVRCWRCRCAN